MDKLLDIVKGVAPGLATALGGPLAGAAVSAIAEKFGVEDTVEAVATALQGASPEQLAKLQEIDLKKLELENADRDSARKAHMAIATNPDAHILEKLTMPILALGTVSLAFLLIGILLFINIPDSQENIIIFALGFITSAATQVLSFYFGSSQGSKDKTDAVKALKK
jgi:VIT1/CCC1 family predicted Fe2+/Mn2+ transporter